MVDEPVESSFSLSSNPPHLPLKEVRPHGVEKERGHRSIAIAVELLAVSDNVEEEAHPTLEPAALA